MSGPRPRRAACLRLYEHIVQAARQQADVLGIRLCVEPNNKHAQEAYRRLGMTMAGYLLLEKYPL